MADFSALKTSIQNYIKQNGNEEITGNLLQQILLSMVSTLGDSAINDLVTALNAEIANRGNADTELNGRITTLQGVVNGVIANVENGYVYAGIATPSSTPASGKVFYLALTAGTYTNFGATVVPQGINILKYNGSAWSLDSFLGLDDAPTQGSSNLVKSGGVLDSIIKDGSAFDLSAYNNGTTYADLSAALTVLNVLPAAYKKGGMSMKFVQTSDNKYVQFRLMSDEWSTDTDDWSFYGNDVLTEDSDFIYVETDNEGKILWGVKADADFYFGLGCPTQVQEYVLEHKADILKRLNDKVDKEEGKSLIDAQYASGIESIEDSEYIDVETDSEDKVLGGRKTDGVKFETVGYETPKINVGGSTTKTVYDSEDRVDVLTDTEDKVIAYRKKDGTKVENVGFETKKLSAEDAAIESGEAKTFAIKDLTLTDGIPESFMNVEIEYPAQKYIPVLINLNKKAKLTAADGGHGNDDAPVEPLVLLHFSDIHGDKGRLERIAKFNKLYKKFNYYGKDIKLIDDVLCTGDIVLSSYDNPQYGDFKFWQDAGANGFLNCVGNHDVMSETTGQRQGIPYTEEECFKRYFIGYKDDDWSNQSKLMSDNPMYNTWGATIISNKCYYYKDYADSKIRLIVMDSEHLSDEQNDWVKGLLDEIIEEGLGLSVIIALHKYPSFERINTSFSTLQPVITYNNNYDIIEAVDAFINRGGDFICWLCGHAHRDQFGYIKLGDVEYKNQTVYVINKALADYPWYYNWNGDDWSDTDGRYIGSTFQDCFNLFKADTYEGFITLFRIGLNYDGHLQKKEVLIYDYRNHKIMFNQ